MSAPDIPLIIIHRGRCNAWRWTQKRRGRPYGAVKIHDHRHLVDRRDTAFSSQNPPWTRAASFVLVPVRKDAETPATPPSALGCCGSLLRGGPLLHAHYQPPLAPVCVPFTRGLRQRSICPLRARASRCKPLPTPVAPDSAARRVEGCPGRCRDKMCYVGVIPFAGDGCLSRRS